MTPDLAAILASPTFRSTSGHPWLGRPGWDRLRDWVPHLLRDGVRVLDALGAHPPSDAADVIRQVVLTAAITAPSDLWLLRHVLSDLRGAGWTDRLLAGIDTAPDAIRAELHLLQARGYLVRTAGGGWAASPDPTAQRVLRELPMLPAVPRDLGRRWARLLSGVRDDEALLRGLLADPIPEAAHPPPAWVAAPEDLEVGYRLVPLALGMRAAGVGPDAVPAEARALLERAGWLRDGAPTALGARALARAAGPMGIIEAYWPWLAAGLAAGAHVARAANVAASQDANRASFRRANDALDRYCADTGFRYRVFVEHAVGHGEAIRQRWARSGDAVAYVGADLEPDALAAARAEVAAGRLPPQTQLVLADVGRPDLLVAALREAGLEPRGAVLVVGNGLHEVRGVDDDGMVAVLRGYADAGFLLIFTEESALSTDDLLATAWNTYHAGFRYVHERSGQQLRPATPPRAGSGPLRASWAECAARAGYVVLDAYGWRSRTIHPHPSADGHDPAISATTFCVPRAGG